MELDRINDQEYFLIWIKQFKLDDYTHSKHVNGFTIRSFAVFDNWDELKTLLVPRIEEEFGEELPARMYGRFEMAFEKAQTVVKSMYDNKE